MGQRYLEDFVTHVAHPVCWPLDSVRPASTPHVGPAALGRGGGGGGGGRPLGGSGGCPCWGSARWSPRFSNYLPSSWIHVGSRGFPGRPRPNRRRCRTDPVPGGTARDARCWYPEGSAAPGSSERTGASAPTVAGGDGSFGVCSVVSESPSSGRASPPGAGPYSLHQGVA